MKRVYLFRLVLALTTALGLSQCKKQAPRICDETLYPFLLGGIYVVHEHGGAAATFELIRHEVASPPGTPAFLAELDTAYRQLMAFPCRRLNDSSRVQARAWLDEWHSIRSQKDLDVFIKDEMVSGRQAIYERYRKALDEHGGKKADVLKIDPIRYHLPYSDDAPETFAYIKMHYDMFSPSGIRAYDIARLVKVICIAYQAEYISKHESLARLRILANTARQYYSDWQTYYNDFLLGKAHWGEDEGGGFMSYSRDAEEMQHGAYSIYAYVPFK